MKTITRADVAETIYEEIGLSRKDSNDILDMILDEITQELVRGNDVKLSSFGTFSLRDKKIDKKEGIIFLSIFLAYYTFVVIGK